MEIYTHAVDGKKRSAQSKVVEMVLPKPSVPNLPKTPVATEEVTA
jgi:hypothetical protein